MKSSEVGAARTVTIRGIVGVLGAVAVALVCVRLGVWQLHRLAQRDARNALLAERMSAQPLELNGALPDTAGLVYRRVRLSGEADAERTVVLAGQSLDGVPGVHVLTPIAVAGGRYVLLDRGFVPSPDAATIDLSRVPAVAPGRVEGIAITFEREGGRGARGSASRVDSIGATHRRVVYRMEKRRLAGLFPYDIADFYVQAVPANPASAARPPSPGENAGGAILPAPPPLPRLTDRGPHLGYAIQWFSFAAIALIGSVAIWLRRSSGEPLR